MPKTRRACRDALRALAGGMVILGAGDAGAAEPPLAGIWGGDRAQLTLHDRGGRLELDCGYATLDGPLAPDGRGRFRVRAAYYPARGGPVDADAPPAETPAWLEGTVKGSNLDLSLKPSGASEVQVFHMTAGKREKLVRCL